MKKRRTASDKFFRKATFNLTTNLKCLFVYLFALIYFNYLPAQESRVWDYPVHAGTTEWQNLGTFHQRLNALNIPDTLIVNMATRDLVNTCLNYPYKILLTSRNNNQEGYDFLYSVFNGFGELERRTDAPEELIMLYQALNPEEASSKPTLEEKGEFAFQFTFIEILISQRTILAKLTQENLKTLLRKSLTVYDGKKEAEEIFSFYDLTTTCLLLSRILKQNNISSFKDLEESNTGLMNFIKYGTIPEKKLADQIAKLSKDYLKLIEL